MSESTLSGGITVQEYLNANKQLFSGVRDCNNEMVKKRLSEVKEQDYIRLPARSERQRIQKSCLLYQNFLQLR